MIWTLTNGEDVFEIANGDDRTCRVDASADGQMTQDTPTALRLRALFPVAFIERATRTYEFSIPVTFPECATLEEAFIQSLTIPALCPPGGTLTGMLNGDGITFAQAWVSAVPWERTGVSNRFVFNVRATDPTYANLSPLAQMDSRYVIALKNITGLAGGTSSDLDSLVTTDVAVGMIGFALITLSSIATPKHFQLVTGTEAEQLDPDVGLIVVRPDDHHATTNPKVWIERS